MIPALLAVLAFFVGAAFGAWRARREARRRRAILRLLFAHAPLRGVAVREALGLGVGAYLTLLEMDVDGWVRGHDEATPGAAGIVRWYALTAAGELAARALAAREVRP